MALSLPKLPDFYDDPLYKSSNDTLNNYGMGILQGQVPDFYKMIGQQGSPELENVIGMTNRDISRSALEAAAKTGARGAGVSSAIAKATADNSTKLRWQDMLRSIDDKKWLFGTGLDTIGGVRNSAFDFMNAKNSFNLNRTGLETDQAKLIQADKDRKSAAWASILSAGLGAAGTIGGFMVGGPAGASVGGSAGTALGSAATGGSKVSGALGNQGGYWSNLQF